MRRTKACVWLAGLVAVFGASSPIRADSMTHTGSFPLGFPPTLTDTNWATSLSFPKFDPALGILHTIRFRLEGTLRGSFSGEAITDANISLMTNGVLTLSRFDGTQLIISIMPSPGTMILDLGMGETFTESVTDSRNELTMIDSSHPLFGDFIGPGTIALPFDATGNSVITENSGNVDATVLTFAGGRASVTYLFNGSNVVPEPSTLVLAGIAGSCSVLLLRRRRR